MESRNFGITGLKVSVLGYGAGHIGDPAMDEKKVEKLLKTALDVGITLFDTARGYGESEARIGKYLSKKRDRIVLSTKVGYGVPGHTDWTYDGVLAGVELAHTLMKTDWIDIVHLHSCPAHVLHHHGVLDALQKCLEEGKLRVVAYSGEQHDLREAIYTGKIGSIQASLNVFDQRIIDDQLALAKSRGLGMIAKRPVANAPWRFTEPPHGHYCEPYWHRMKAMGLDFGKEWNEIALRFAAYTWGVDTVIVGTTSEQHIKENAAQVQKGKLDDQVIWHLRDAFRQHDEGWVGQL